MAKSVFMAGEKSEWINEQINRLLKCQNQSTGLN